MKRLTDSVVALLFVMMVVITYKNLTRKPSPAPAPSPVEPVLNQEPLAPPQPPPEANPQIRQDPQPEPWNISSSTSAPPEEGRLRVERIPSPEPDFPGRDQATTSSTASDVDVKRREAREKLARVFQSLGPNGRSLIQNVERHIRACGRVTDGFCAQSLENIGRQAFQVGAQLEYAQELARTSWLPPGEVRDLREKHGIDDGVFDQIVRIVNRYAP